MTGAGESGGHSDFGNPKFWGGKGLGGVCSRYGGPGRVSGTGLVMGQSGTPLTLGT